MQIPIRELALLENRLDTLYFGSKLDIITRIINYYPSKNIMELCKKYKRFLSLYALWDEYDDEEKFKTFREYYQLCIEWNDANNEIDEIVKSHQIPDNLFSTYR